VESSNRILRFIITDTLRSQSRNRKLGFINFKAELKFPRCLNRKLEEKINSISVAKIFSETKRKKLGSIYSGK
jgi:hypothetical protein